MTGTHTETIPLVDETQLRVTIGEPDGAVRGGVVVLHESRGMTSRTEAIVEALAGEGWLAVAPHLYHRDDPGIDEQTDDDEAVGRGAAAISGESVLADSDAAFGMLAERGVSSDRMAVLGFDIGATAALVVAAQRSLGAVVTVSAAGVTSPLATGLPPLIDVVGELTCPWLGLYGESGDPVEPAEVDHLREAAHASGRVVDVVVYPSREHRFDADERAAAQPDPLDEGNSEEATKMEARSRVLNWLDAHLR
ncbi:dienelactone hydrolase family protein [Actinomycetospora cinnamomea]|uniref:Carboxymethylenebutenolidase n=1 Tax=Actinomycetospora cinnamomea TaxID=663609 RepID=A0A2U1FBD7_9PSEU|nr:dienelactone hydrolase family protein [Actinomycetospora cinnamomea]PVZ09497.1 carboxymethylenebutenolidase [Actinomycetospora cinnamomea]